MRKRIARKIIRQYAVNYRFTTFGRAYRHPWFMRYKSRMNRDTAREQGKLFSIAPANR